MANKKNYTRDVDFTVDYERESLKGKLKRRTNN